MTSNRYQINESNFIVEILDDGIPMHYSTIVNRLNEQHETIHRLEQNIDELLSVDVEEELLKENEQLKSEIKDLNDILARYEEKELEE